MSTDREGLTATLLDNGQVLAAGGTNESSPGRLASAELYDPTSNTWTATGSMVRGRFSGSATLLDDGHVLVAGGNTDGAANSTEAELYHPPTAMTEAQRR